MALRSPLLPVLLASTLVGTAEARATDNQGVVSPPVAAKTPGESTPKAKPPDASAPPEPTRPPPLHVEYAQYGAALTSTISASQGATCQPEVLPGQPKPPCIIGSGGGLAIRIGYRSAGPWYLGGAYEFTKMDSGNLYRLGIFQQLRAEVRYLPDIGSRAAPFVSWGAGGFVYGNEWFLGVETGGALVFVGGGVEIEVSRLAVIGLGISYRPTLIAGWRDTASILRPTGVAQFVGIELQLEVRTELGRR